MSCIITADKGRAKPTTPLHSFLLLQPHLIQFRPAQIRLIRANPRSILHNRKTVLRPRLPKLRERTNHLHRYRHVDDDPADVDQNGNKRRTHQCLVDSQPAKQ